MNNEKRFVLFIIVMFLWMLGFPYVMRMLGLAPTPKKPPAPEPANTNASAKEEPGKKAEVIAGQDEEKPADESKPKEKAEEQAAPEAPKPPEVPLVEESELVLGSALDNTPGGYRLQAHLTQRGAGIDRLLSSRYDAEYENGRTVKRPLQLINGLHFPPSLSITLNASSEANADANATAESEDDEELAVAVEEAEDWLDSVFWEVVLDNGNVKRPARVVDPSTKQEVDGEAIVFRTKAPNGTIVTKTIRLGKGIDGLEMELMFESPDQMREVVYNLTGPHGIPIEGEWYTSNFRDLVFGALTIDGSVDPITNSANDVAKAGDKPVDNTALPLRYAAVENQYFATILEPVPPPTGQQDRWDNRTIGLFHPRKDALQKSDITFRIQSKPMMVAPEKPVVHTYRLFAGPKMSETLGPYGADRLASNRKNQWIPFAPWLAREVITPTLGMTYGVTAWVARLFGGKQGNYGIAIILLTVLVRGFMFPLGLKTARSAQKMQALQPYMKAIQEKYKDDKEQLTRETFALYKRYGVNPMGGCLPALIQMPIFVGLWQGLSNSVQLRHATFLWIDDLAAPDMMFPFPMHVPLLGEWFNLLPFLGVGLMVLQTQLFSPPATTPEAEQSQKMMKYMMVFMGVMFYKIPSGMCIYLVTSSLWALCERLLLPKVTHADLKPVGETVEGEDGGDGSPAKLAGDGRGPRGGSGKGTSGGNGERKRTGRFAQFWEKVLEEAEKNSTYRKAAEEREVRARDKEKGDPRPRPRRR